MLPSHVAIIMDGNGRWATRRGLPRGEGHKAGVKAARAVVTHACNLGIRHLTMYTFSRENWGRPAAEVSLLFELLCNFLDRETQSLTRQNIRLTVLGELKDIPFAACHALKSAVSASRHCTGMRLNLALNYGGRDEILRACKRLLKSGQNPDELDEETFSTQLYTAGQPDPDLVIRTSGELRISNFLLWQTAYAEFYFTDTLWPDFTPQELDKALDGFASRERRFGKTGEQIEHRKDPAKER